VSRSGTRTRTAASLLAVALTVTLAFGADEPDPLKVGSEFGNDGHILVPPKGDEQKMTVTVGKNVVAIVDISGKFPVRMDKAVRIGTGGAAIFKEGRKVAVLGRPSRLQRTRDDPGVPRVAPYHAIVVGDGLEPKAVLPPAKEKFGDAVEWFKGTIDGFEPPYTFWMKEAGKPENAQGRYVTVGRDEWILTTTAYESADFQKGDLRRALAKGQAVRFRGTITTVLYMDSKGRLIEETERRKAGVKAEVHLTASRLALIDPTYPYAFVESPTEP
jgi:hypothetical protein